MDNDIKIVGTTVNPEAKGTNSRHWVHDTSGIIGTIDATTYKQPKQILVESPVRLGNIYGEDKGTGFTGNVWDKEAINPTLTTMQGGNRTPIVVVEPKMTLNEESLIWIPIVGYEGLYEVSNRGDVRSLDKEVESGLNRGQKRNIKGKVLLQKTDKDGYKNIQLTKDGYRKDYRVHRLVLSSFTVKCDEKEVNHIDGIKDNNNIFNLEYCTSLENQQHRNNVLRKRGKYEQKRGVSWNTEKGKWSAFIKINNKSIFLGYSDDKEECYEMYFNRFVSEFGYEPWNRQPMVVVDKSIKHCVAKNFEKELDEIAISEKDIYQAQCDSGWQDNKIGLKISQTIRANNSFAPVLDNNFTIRKLTPLECFRLMGMSDENFYKIKAKGISDSQLYKLAGNSICVNVLKHIFISLFKYN